VEVREMTTPLLMMIWKNTTHISWVEHGWKKVFDGVV